MCYLFINNVLRLDLIYMKTYLKQFDIMTYLQWFDTMTYLGIYTAQRSHPIPRYFSGGIVHNTTKLCFVQNNLWYKRRWKSFFFLGPLCMSNLYSNYKYVMDDGPNWLSVMMLNTTNIFCITLILLAVMNSWDMYTFEIC